tara:strand:- start:451 stop:633 length:183 start_codon:yes stop_codon:yes gene_type:complete
VQHIGLQRLNGDLMKLVKIVHEKAKDGWALINESDFDPKLHKLYEAKKKAVKKKVTTEKG